jgi:hypothetical protein
MNAFSHDMLINGCQSERLGQWALAVGAHSYSQRADMYVLAQEDEWLNPLRTLKGDALIPSQEVLIVSFNGFLSDGKSTIAIFYAGANTVVLCQEQKNMLAVSYAPSIEVTPSCFFQHLLSLSNDNALRQNNSDYFAPTKAGIAMIQRLATLDKDNVL